MVKIHNLGFPRIGAGRELKFALEKYWRGELTEDELQAVGEEMRAFACQKQEGLDYVPVGDFSFYDHVLDLSFLVDNVPARARGRTLDDYFRVARGRAPSDHDGQGICAGEMTKWFDTNYHYIVPEFEKNTRFQLNADQLLRQVKAAQLAGVEAKPVLVGPVTYLLLGKAKDEVDPLSLLPALLAVYRELLTELASAGVEWVQLDEPILVTELSPAQREALQVAYEALSFCGPKVLLASYFGKLLENVDLLASLPVHGVHIDAVRGRGDIARLTALLPSTSVLSLGVVDGRNIWRTDLAQALDILEPIHRERGDRLWVAPSCSLLHVPVDTLGEKKMDAEVRSWLSFAVQKLCEVKLLGRALNEGRASVSDELVLHQSFIERRRASARVHRSEVADALGRLTGAPAQRKSPYLARRAVQADALRLPEFPTTTIGSFPQTSEIRRVRRSYLKGELGGKAYQAAMRREIAQAISKQEALGLDVLVHGEPERNDMVEYFGEQLEGYVISENGWVQSYGSRCVKPPILYGDVSRRGSMTSEWIQYAQSLTKKPVKGMLTGPVTILNWSFVRDDQARSLSCFQIALAIQGEVLSLEEGGCPIVQIDEAALREGLPLRKSEWEAYLAWAVRAFRIASSAVKDVTQIHTHMCYSEFNDIIESIAALDADVITIECSRSGMELLEVLDSFSYPNQIGPGVYDIHSPNVPTQAQIEGLMRRAAEKIPSSQLWVNPDCGLKTRTWEEVLPALRNMVKAAHALRAGTQPGVAAAV